jgi:hypothetical protein
MRSSWATLGIVIGYTAGATWSDAAIPCLLRTKKPCTCHLRVCFPATFRRSGDSTLFALIRGFLQMHEIAVHHLLASAEILVLRITSRVLQLLPGSHVRSDHEVEFRSTNQSCDGEYKSSEALYFIPAPNQTTLILRIFDNKNHQHQ